jgi:hypothetical protein
MEHKFQTFLYDSFARLIEEHGFSKLKELNDEQAYFIEYCSNTFVIHLEKYRREFDITLYKTGYTDKRVNLFNLLSYLNQASSEVPSNGSPKADDGVFEDSIMVEAVKKL